MGSGEKVASKNDAKYSIRLVTIRHGSIPFLESESDEVLIVVHCTIVDSIVLGSGVEHVSFYSRTELPASIYSKP